MSRVSTKGVRSLFPASGGEVTSLFMDSGDSLEDGLGVEALAPPLPPLPPAMTPEVAERLGRAVAQLNAAGARAGAEIAVTALEIALLVARKILDAEVRSDPSVARDLIKAAVRRLGDVHKVTLRLTPEDAESLRASASDGVAAELGVAKVEIVTDTNLTAGDCIVESDAATVDGRLGTRVEELRRVLEAAINSEAATS
jgi:flagellar biosynthesis/type III secretory pathway protein FliH